MVSLMSTRLFSQANFTVQALSWPGAAELGDLQTSLIRFIDEKK